MKAKDKAVELFDKYFDYVEAFTSKQQHDNAKRCALMVVDEIFSIDIYTEFDIKPKYWQDVKDEIERL